jgi:hypothetical protein
MREVCVMLGAREACGSEKEGHGEDRKVVGATWGLGRKVRKSFNLITSD